MPIFIAPLLRKWFRFARKPHGYFREKKHFTAGKSGLPWQVVHKRVPSETGSPPPPPV